MQEWSTKWKLGDLINQLVENGYDIAPALCTITEDRLVDLVPNVRPGDLVKFKFAVDELKCSISTHEEVSPFILSFHKMSLITLKPRLSLVIEFKQLQCLRIPHYHSHVDILDVLSAITSCTTHTLITNTTAPILFVSPSNRALPIQGIYTKPSWSRFKERSSERLENHEMYLGIEKEPRKRRRRSCSSLRPFPNM